MSRAASGRRAARHGALVLGAVITATIASVALLSLVYTPYDPLQMDLGARLAGPSATHPLGTDQYGRDLLARIMRGAVSSLAVGAVSVSLALGLGVVAGTAGGYLGGCFP